MRQRTPFGDFGKVACLALLCTLWACRDSASEPSIAPQTIPDGQITSDQAPVAPMDAIRMTSRVEYAGAPEDPHSLQLTLGDRGFARLKLASDPEVQGRRVLQHVWNGQLFVTSARSSSSVELSGPSSQDSKGWFALRRALCDWGDPAAWETNPEQPTQRLLKQAEGPPIVADIEATGMQPKSIGLYGPEGEVLQRLSHIEWALDVAPPRPIAFHVENSTGLIWRETEVHIRRGFQMRPEFFLPPDRRSERGPAAASASPK